VHKLVIKLSEQKCTVKQ